MSSSEINGIIFDIKKLAVHDGPGIRTTVFFKGCPLACIWCHNPEGIGRRPELGFFERKCSNCGACAAVCPTGAHKMTDDGKHILDRALCTHCFACVGACLWEALTIYGRVVSVDEVFEELLADKNFFTESGGGVTISGGEPLTQPEFAAALLRRCTEAGIHTCVDTSGSVPWKAIERVLPYTRMFLYDVKFFDEDLHIRYTGVSNKLILENLTKLGSCDVPIEIRIPIIPHINDSEEQLKKTAGLLAGIPSISGVRILPYNELAQTKYTLIGVDSTVPDERKQTKETMQNYARLLEGFGLSVVAGE
ncbi:MAG: glycyl-radical enzyme activating protein [Acetanaerobacterium sp.]